MTDKFKEFVDILSMCDIKEFNNVKVVLLSQAIIETGYGKSDLFQRVKNPLGMKHRDFLAKFAFKYKYYTDSEPERLEDDGSGKMARYDYFCGFDEFLPALQCWCYKIKNQDVYSQCLNYLDNPKQFLVELAKIWAADDKYFDKVYAKFEESYTLLKNSEPNIDDKIKEAIDNHIKLYHKGASSDNSDNSDNDKDGNNGGSTPTKKYKIMLNSGHAGTSGASGKSKDIKEYVENKATVEELKRLLEQHKEFNVKIVNQNDNNLGLEGVGKSTKDYDLAIAVHYNASDAVEHGCEVLVPTNANLVVKEFAKMLCDTMAKNANLINRGVKEQSLAVFTGYKSVENNQCVFVLSEGHFIDDETDASECRKKSILNAKSHYETIKNWYKIA